jgi:hypothetical protein
MSFTACSDENKNRMALQGSAGIGGRATNHRLCYDVNVVMARAAVGFLVLALAVSAGAAGSVLHLCGMEGLVQRVCCCHEAEQAPPVALKPIDECCAGLMSKGEQPASSIASSKASVDAPTLALASSPHGELRRARETSAAKIPLARGSPYEHGPPLFVLNCSYLN